MRKLLLSAAAFYAAMRICSSAHATPLFTDGFESYTQGSLDSNLASGPNQAPDGSGNPWFGPAPPNAQVVGAENGITPHSGSQMIRGHFPNDFDQNWLNIAYRFNGGQTYTGGLIFDWWFYDQLGAGGTTLNDYNALGFYNTAPGDTDYTGAGNLNSATQVERLSLGASSDHNPGFDASFYQARVPGAGDGYHNGWFNTPTQRSVGWHEMRIVVGPALADSTNTVHFFIDNMSTPVLSHNSVLTYGYNVLELNTFFGPTTGYTDDVTFDRVKPGDATLNGAVDFADVLRLIQNYGQNGASWETGDFNNDGTVNFNDVLLLIQNYGQNVTAGQAAGALAQVPEPAAGALCGAGTLLLLQRRRRSCTGK